MNNREALNRGFAFHRHCNGLVFTAYSLAEGEELLAATAKHNSCTPSQTLCETYTVATMAAIFNRVEICAHTGDLFYQIAQQS